MKIRLLTEFCKLVNISIILLMLSVILTIISLIFTMALFMFKMLTSMVFKLLEIVVLSKCKVLSISLVLASKFLTLMANLIVALVNVFIKSTKGKSSEPELGMGGKLEDGELGRPNGIFKAHYLE